MDLLEVNDSPPDGVKVLSNGAWQNEETGKIVKAAPDQAWDSAEASRMAKKRWAKVREKTRANIKEAVEEKHPDEVFEDFPDAHGQVVKTLMTDVVLGTNGEGGKDPEEKGKKRIDSYISLLAIEGSMKTQQGLDRVNPGMIITFSPDVAKHMMDRLAERRERMGPVVIEAGE